MRSVSRSLDDPSPPGGDIAGRAQVEPVAALVALLAVGAGLGLYAVALEEAAPDRERDPATTTLDRVEREATVSGVVDPERLTIPAGVARGATTVRAELRAAGRSWRVGESGAVEGSDRRSTRNRTEATRAVTVRVAPGENVRGTLRVVIGR